MANKYEITEDWKLRQIGQNYNTRLDPPYYDTIDKNYRMIGGDQWHGVVAKGLSTPVFNQIKPTVKHQIASITSQDIKMVISSRKEKDERTINILNAMFEDIWEDSQMSTNIRQLLHDGAVTGDYAMFCRIDELYGTGEMVGLEGEEEEVMGIIENEIIDSVNVYLGNPNEKRINYHGRPIQPYVLLEFRDMTSKLKEMAKKDGQSEDEISRIIGDNNTEYQSGDRGKIELDNTNDESAKTTTLIKLFHKDGHIYARQSVKSACIRKEWDTGYTIYPFAWGNWDSIKNSYHGQALCTEIIPNQLFINKLFAMEMASIVDNAFPTRVYDKTRIQSVSNSVSKNYGVDGDISGAIQNIDGANHSYQVDNLAQTVISLTKESVGSSDVLMGNVDPDNTSAIIAASTLAAVPLETIKLNMHQFVEDLGYIWIDMMAAKYGKRTVEVEIVNEQGAKEMVSEVIDFSKLRDMRLRVKIDVGSSSYFNKQASDATMSNLLAGGHIGFARFLKSTSDNIVQDKEEMIREAEAREQAMMQQQTPQQQPMVQPSDEEMEAVAEFIKALPPDAQEKLLALGDETLIYQKALEMINERT